MKYTALLPDVLTLLVADPSEPVAEARARDTVIDFCRRSRVWQEYSDPIDIEADEAEYTVELPSAAELVAILSITIDGVAIDPESADRLDDSVPTWRTDTGESTHFTLLDPTTIRFTPVPDTAIAGGLVVRMALAPKRSSTTFLDWIGNQFHEALVWGTAARLMLMPNRPWSERATGAAYLARFEAAAAAAVETALRGHTRAPTRTLTQH